METETMIIQPIPIHDQATRHAGKHGDKQDGKGNGFGIGQPGDPMNTLTKGDRHVVAYEAIPLDLRNAGRDPEKHDEINRQGVGVGEAGDPAHTLTSACVHGVAQPVYELHSQDSRVTELKEVCSTVSATYGAGGGNIPVTVQPVAYAFEPNITKREGNESRFVEEMSPTLRSGMGDNQVAVIQPMAVRRLTPIECEALQGFPKNYTNIPWRKKEESPDGPRYKALGNSMAVPVMHWIGKRIADAP